LNLKFKARAARAGGRTFRVTLTVQPGVTDRHGAVTVTGPSRSPASVTPAVRQCQWTQPECQCRCSVPAGSEPRSRAVTVTARSATAAAAVGAARPAGGPDRPPTPPLRLSPAPSHVTESVLRSLPQHESLCHAGVCRPPPAGSSSDPTRASRLSRAYHVSVSVSCLPPLSRQPLPGTVNPFRKSDENVALSAK
jgi:hypothetical protein